MGFLVALAFVTGRSTADLEILLACCCVQGRECVTLQAAVVALNDLIRGPAHSLMHLRFRQLASFKASVLPLLLLLPSAPLKAVAHGTCMGSHSSSAVEAPQCMARVTA